MNTRMQKVIELDWFFLSAIITDTRDQQKRNQYYELVTALGTTLRIVDVRNLPPLYTDSTRCIHRNREPPAQVCSSFLC